MHPTFTLFYITDLYPMHFVLCNDMMINDGKKEIEFRNLKAVDPELFKLDITNFLSNSDKWLNSFSDSINLFNVKRYLILMHQLKRKSLES